MQEAYNLRARHHAQDHREGDPRALEGTAQDDFVDVTKPAKKAKQSDIPLEELPQIISAMRREMFDLSEALEFEKAAALRDKIKELEEIRLSLGGRDEPSRLRRLSARSVRAAARCATPSVSHWRSRRDFAP